MAAETQNQLPPPPQSSGNAPRASRAPKTGGRPPR